MSLLLDTYALIQLADIKSVLAITDTTQDDNLIRAINSACGLVEAFCDRKFMARDYTEYYDGGGVPTLVLKQFPINSITEVADDPNREWSTASIIDATNYVYYADEGIVKLLSGFFIFSEQGTFAKAVQNVRVKYNAGYDSSSIPWELQTIVMDVAIKKFKTLADNRVGQSSASVHGVSVTYSLNDLLPDHKDILINRFKRISISTGDF